MISTRNIAVLSVFSCLFIIGFVLMGYEMLGSRYLNPHFGGGITTWAGLISVVLLAMMVGYLTGGYLVDSRPNIDLLSFLCFFAGLSIASMTLIADQLLSAILAAFGDQLIGVLLAAAAISFVPVALLSASSPFVVRLLLQDLRTGGMTAGWVYGVSTLGNVFGTLVTTFAFIPAFGTRAITLYFGIALISLSIIIFIFRNRITLGLGKTSLQTAVTILAFLIIFNPVSTKAAPALDLDANYPEGPVWHKNKLYYAEMSGNRVAVLEKDKPSTFWSEKKCGPTSISRYGKNSFLVLCHLTAKLVVLSEDGQKLKEISHAGSRRLFQNPNDSHSDGKGGVFFSDAGIFQKGAKASGIVYHLSPEGRLHKVAENLYYANGIAFDAEKQILYVSEHLAGKVWALHIRKDLSIKKKEMLLDISTLWKASDIDYAETGPDGIELLGNGAIAVAIYGKSTILILHNNSASKYEIGAKFVTNIAGNGKKIAITGSHSNQIYPYRGRVRIIAISDMKEYLIQ
ncbi:MAG: fused MFS/spermidine synthase [Methyloligellaceae bacterium]